MKSFPPRSEGVDETGWPPGPLVMLADDQADYRSTIAFHLAMAGYPVLEAGSVSAVVARAKTVRPDVVVVSDELGGGDVSRLFMSLRDEAALGDVPVITVSSDMGPGRLVECLAVGARDHVRRQDGADELVARVDAVLRADDELERLRRRNAELEFLGTTDPTTGLGNRRRIEDEYERLSAGASRHGVPLSVAMLRVDDLEGTADTVRARRDAVVRELGFLIAAVRRADDFAGMWDESTFVLLLAMTRLDGALTFVRRLQSVVKAAPVHDGEDRIAVTLSASCAEASGEVGGLLCRMEEAIVAVRSDGGDRIVVTS